MQQRALHRGILQICSKNANSVSNAEHLPCNQKLPRSLLLQATSAAKGGMPQPCRCLQNLPARVQYLRLSQDRLTTHLRHAQAHRRLEVVAGEQRSANRSAWAKKQPEGSQSVPPSEDREGAADLVCPAALSGFLSPNPCDFLHAEHAPDTHAPA